MPNLLESFFRYVLTQPLDLLPGGFGVELGGAYKHVAGHYRGGLRRSKGQREE